jgi:hypothetical protein
MALLCPVAFVAACADPSANPASPTGLVSSDGASAKPPGTTLIPATITFSDRPGDAITSDGGGSYVNGALEVGFYTDSKDLVLKGDSRALTLNHTNRISGTGPIGTTLVTSIFVNVHGILDMALGESRVATVAVHRTSMEVFRFNSIYTGATTVNVVRDGSGVWTVTADDPSSDRAALTKSPKNSTLGVYAMPFQLTALCPTCS